MDKSETTAAQPSETMLPRPHRLIRRLAWLYGVFVAATLLLLACEWLPTSLAPLHTFIHEVLHGGGGGLVLATLWLMFTALLGTLALTTARHRHALDVERGRTVASARTRWSLSEPGFAARQGQAFIYSAGAILLWLSVRLLWPATTGPTAAPGGTAADIVGAFALALAFVALMTERTMDAFPEPQLPEAPALRRLLLLTTVLLALAGGVEFGRAAMQAWIRWPQMIIAFVPCLVILELLLRALARLFLPPPAPANARAVADSILVGLLTGGPRAPGTLLRTHFGLDFARSWALAFLSRAVMPAVLGTALLCWGLSGLKLIELGQRGVYERFGAPVAVMGPGLHLLLPWPLGRMRPVEYGTIHRVAIGVSKADSNDNPLIPAEATPPLVLNRLWESSHPGQADYLVPGPGAGQEGFQSVSTEISVLYRVGLTDEAALQSVYTLADPESLIKEDASRLVLRYFNSRTLDAVLGAKRENVAGHLRSELQTDMNSHNAGIDIVAVVIEEIHPPAGAAAAYHAVQAAQINANASISDEIGRAHRTAGVAQQEAHALTTAATAAAAETLHDANADAYRFNADRTADTEAGQAFLLERRFADLEAALTKTPLTLIDHRLSSAQAPIVDLRTLVPTVGARGGDANGSAAGVSGATTGATTGGSNVTKAAADLLPSLTLSREGEVEQ